MHLNASSQAHLYCHHPVSCHLFCPCTDPLCCALYIVAFMFSGKIWISWCRGPGGSLWNVFCCEWSISCGLRYTMTGPCPLFSINVSSFLSPPPPMLCLLTVTNSWACLCLFTGKFPGPRVVSASQCMLTTDCSVHLGRFSYRFWK